VLPDDSTGQGPGTRQLAGQKTVTVQGGYGVVFAIRVQVLSKPGVSRYKFSRSRETVTVQDFYCGYWRSVAVQVWSEPENCQDVGFKLRAGARVRMQDVKRIYMASRARNDDKRSKEKREFGPILNIRFLLG
jgi:hypothetical protein